jgi:hypothetical protein
MSLPVIWDDPLDERDGAVVLHDWELIANLNESSPVQKIARGGLLVTMSDCRYRSPRTVTRVPCSNRGDMEIGARPTYY